MYVLGRVVCEDATNHTHKTLHGLGLARANVIDHLRVRSSSQFPLLSTAPSSSAGRDSSPPSVSTAVFGADTSAFPVLLALSPAETGAETGAEPGADRSAFPLLTMVAALSPAETGAETRTEGLAIGTGRCPLTSPPSPPAPRVGSVVGCSLAGDFLACLLAGEVAAPGCVFLELRGRCRIDVKT